MNETEVREEIAKRESYLRQQRARKAGKRFYADRNETDSARYGQELWGVRAVGTVGWCAITYGIQTTMMNTPEGAEADAERLNKAAGS